MRENGVISAKVLADGFAALSADVLRLAASPSRRVRITVDGAVFDDLPLELGRAGLFYRPLYTGPDRRAGDYWSRLGL